jgi:hypothetical protein
VCHPGDKSSLCWFQRIKNQWLFNPNPVVVNITVSYSDILSGKPSVYVNIKILLYFVFKDIFLTGVKHAAGIGKSRKATVIQSGSQINEFIHFKTTG